MAIFIPYTGAIDNGRGGVVGEEGGIYLLVGWVWRLVVLPTGRMVAMDGTGGGAAAVVHLKWG